MAVRNQLTAEDPMGRWDTVRDLIAAVLLVAGLLLPWNLYSGVGIPGSSGTLFAVLGAVTLLSLISVALTFGTKTQNDRRRLLLNIPYLLLVLAFIGFDAFETVRFGGSVTVPGGAGPGAWAGLAGALLSAQPVIAGAATTPAGDNRFGGWQKAAKFIGYASMAGAVLSVAFNLYWRLKYALHPTGGATNDFGKQNIAVIATALVYGVVALVAVLVGSRWIVRNTKAAQLAVSALGLSTLLGGTIVWLLPAGRDIDAFHGIAQNTSTAGVGFEGYLAWAAAAAIFAPRTLFGHRNTSAGDENAWRAAARNGLVLITVWCLGSVLMRITDVVIAVMLNYPYSRYDTLMLAAFDLATAVLAIWLRINLGNDSVSARLITALCGLVATLSIARVIVGVELAPRFSEAPNQVQHPVYGNDLAQQITSTFDVVLCLLALGILVAAVITGQLTARRLRRLQRRRRPVAHKRSAQPAPGTSAPTTRIRVGGGAAPPSGAATTVIRTGIPSADATSAMPRQGGAPRIFRGDDSATRQISIPKPRIFRPPSDSNGG